VTSFIKATFNEPIQISSISTSTFTLKDRAGNIVPGIVTLLPPVAGNELNTAVFKPSLPLAFSRAYVATLTTGVKDLAGNFMSSPVTWPFKTMTKADAETSSNPADPDQTPLGSGIPTNPTGDKISPNVVSTSPINGATNVPLLPTITARFSEPLQASTVSISTFKVKDSANNDVQGSVTFGSVGPNVNSAIFKPLSSLAPSKLYSATITNGVKDLAGNSLTNAKKWTFTTTTQSPTGAGQSPPGTNVDPTPLRVVNVNPLDSATGVSLTSPIIVSFSEPVQSSTISATSFKLSTTSAGTSVGPGQIPSIVNVPGTVTVSSDGKIVTFKSAQQLSPGKFYSYSITGVKDLDGNPLTPFPNFVGSFTTG
jgi:hypothetical protein